MYNLHVHIMLPFRNLEKYVSGQIVFPPLILPSTSTMFLLCPSAQWNNQQSWRGRGLRLKAHTSCCITCTCIFQSISSLNFSLLSECINILQLVQLQCLISATWMYCYILVAYRDKYLGDRVGSWSG